MSAAAAREFVTPEGVALRFEVASPADRLAAFLLDGLVILVAALLLVIPAALLWETVGGDWMLAVLFLGLFLLRHGYFVWFETVHRGSTPGKKRLEIWVMDRNGRALTAEAIFARNLTREVEVFLPLLLLLNPDALLPDAPRWGAVIGSLWILALAVLPLCNRDRLRIGDLIAGTIVVRAPRAVLLRDLSGEAPPRARERFPFTPAQLSVYGIYELQVLEEILRSPAPDRKGLEEVCRKIQRKIGWDRARRDVPPADFLRDFYDAQRAHLEGRLLMGERRERKAGGPGTAR